MIQRTKRFISVLLKVSQTLSFYILFGIYALIAITQGYEFINFRIEGMPITFMLGSTIFTLMLLYLAAHALKTRPEERKHLKKSVIGNAVGGVGTILGTILYIRASLHNYDAIVWTRIDSSVIGVQLFGLCFMYVIGSLLNLKLRNPIFLGCLNGLLMGTSQWGLAETIAADGRGGIPTLLIVLGYLLPTVRLFMLVRTPEEHEKEGDASPEKNKIGFLISESINVATWTFVTIQLAHA